MFTYAEAYRRYTERYTHTETLGKEIVTFKPESVVNHKELDEIFKQCKTWDEVLSAMQSRVGSDYSIKTGR